MSLSPSSLPNGSGSDTSSSSPPGVNALSVGGDERALLCSLVEGGAFGPGVKAIFDRGWSGGEYAPMLVDSAVEKQAHIKQICEEHYAEFLAGIEHLLSVKLDLSELRSLAQGLNQSVQQSGRAVLSSARQLNEQRRLRYQINSAKQAVQSCSSLIALARKAKQQIYHAKFFSALKTLNQLQRILHVAATNLHRAQPAAVVAGSGGPNPPLSSPTSATTVAPMSPTGSVVAARAALAAQQQAAQAASNAIRFEFIRQLERQIPLLTGKIKESVKAEFTAWLAGIAKRSQAIGELALSQLDEQLTQATKRAARSSEDADVRRSKRSAAKRLRSGATSADQDDEDEEEEDAVDLPSTAAAAVSHTSGGLFEAIPLNFTAVYQALHIYEHLNLAEQFQHLYKEKRQNQLMEAVGSLALASGPGSPPTSPASGGAPRADVLATYSSVFAQVCGFFIIEDHILKSGNELVSRAEIDAMYEKVQLALIGHMAPHFKATPQAHPPAYLLQLKYLAVLFCKLMGDSFLGHDSGLLRAFLEEQRGHFEELLLRRFRGELKQILAREKWEPLGIHDADEYALFVLGFGLQDSSVSVDFPLTMPFSISVPLVARTLANLVEDYFAFARHLEDAPNAPASTIGGMSIGGDGLVGGSRRVSSAWKGHVLRCVDRALSNEVNRTILDLLQVPNLPISQTVQFSINAQVLAELTCPYLENLVAKYGEDDAAAGTTEEAQAQAQAQQALGSGITSPTGSSSYTLSSRGQLVSTKLRCEDLIFELISGKIDDFLDDLTGGAFQWTPDSVPQGSSDYMLDLVAYLETTFHHMAFMPDAVREAVHFTSCKHIADEMLEALAAVPSSSRPGACKKFTIIGIASLNQDLAVVEAFATRCPIQNLVETFSEIRQLMDLLLGGDIEVLLDAPARAARYPHLATHKLLRILDKFKDVSLFSLSTPAQFKKLKKKNVEAVVKALQKKPN